MVTDTEVLMLQRISALLLEHMDKRRTKFYGADYVKRNPTHAGMINSGDCFNWALIAYLVFGSPRCKLHSVGNHGHHAFISIGEVYIDSDSVYGVDRWRDLCKSFNRYEDVPDERIFYTQTFHEFVDWWDALLETKRLELESWRAIAEQVKCEFALATAA